MVDGPELLILEEVAEMCRTTISSVRDWIRDGRLPACRPGRRVLVRRADVEAMLAESALRVATHGGGGKRKHPL
jgi:excisionase family DNA binding protein